MLGIPASSSHALAGAITGVGLVKNPQNLNRKEIGSIFLDNLHE